jgi:hypothetical protein
MSAEYSGKMDADKTVPVLPRPLTKLQHQIRALDLTGDPTGELPTDDGQFWTGTTREEGLRLEALELARRSFEAAVDSQWYD